MKIRMLSPKSLTPYHRNPRDNSKAIESVAQSINDFGFNQPIVVDKNKVIVVGHTRHSAALLLELAKVPVTDCDHLTKPQIRAYRIADNRTNENSFWLEVELTEELLALKPKQRKSTAFTDGELEELLNTVEAAASAVGKVGLSEEPLESRNYVVLYFDNDVDWVSARAHFRLRSVYSRPRNGKAWGKGIGHVIDGAKYLRRITKNVGKKKR